MEAIKKYGFVAVTIIGIVGVIFLLKTFPAEAKDWEYSWDVKDKIEEMNWYYSEGYKLEQTVAKMKLEEQMKRGAEADWQEIERLKTKIADF